MNKVKKQKIIIQAAMLAALSILFSFIPVYSFPWGMRLDLIAVPWLIALLMLGGAGGFLTSIVSSIILALFTPTGWIGMGAKFLATGVFMLVILAFYWHFKKLTPKLMAVAFVAAVVLRCAVMLPANYYFFVPLWMPTETIASIMEKFPAWMIIVPNVIQSVIDMVIPAYLLFGTKLKKRVGG